MPDSLIADLLSLGARIEFTKDRWGQWGTTVYDSRGVPAGYWSAEFFEEERYVRSGS